jgi:hypothetical protein
MNKTTSPPPTLQKAFLCKKWNCLPSQLDEENYTEMMNMTAALNIHDAFMAWNAHETGKEAEFQRAHPGAWDIVMSLIKEV